MSSLDLKLALQVGCLVSDVAELGDLGQVMWSKAAVVPPTAPLPNSPPSFSNITANSAQINWAPPADGGSPITRNVLHWRAGTTDVFIPINNVVGPFSLTGLAAGTLHQVRVRSDSAVGNGTFSAVSSFTTQPA